MTVRRAGAAPVDLQICWELRVAVIGRQGDWCRRQYGAHDVVVAVVIVIVVEWIAGAFVG